MERKQNESSLVNTHGQSVNSKDIDNQVYNAYDTQNKNLTLNNDSSRNFEKPTISKRFLENTNVDGCFLSKYDNQLNLNINRNDISGFEDQCSKTFIRNSYQVSGILITNSKQMNDNHKNQKASKMSTNKLGIKNRLMHNRNSEQKETSTTENSSGEKAKENHMKRKKQFEKTKFPKRSGMIMNKGLSTSSANMSHRKAMSNYFNSQKNSAVGI